VFANADPRTLATLVVLAGLAALTTFVVFSNRDTDTEDRRPELQLSYYLDAATLTGTGPDGTVLYSVTTRRAQQMSDTQEIELDEINMEYGGPQGLPWTVRADRGRIPEDASVIVLEGNIVAVSGRGHPNRTEIRTQRLDINPDTMLATTNKKVTLLFEQRRLYATGMEADFKSNNLKLLADVNGKFNP